MMRSLNPPEIFNIGNLVHVTLRILGPSHSNANKKRMMLLYVGSPT